MLGHIHISNWAVAIAGLALSVGAIVAPARAEPAPTVVELFTSQSCYSCPPAEALLGEMAGRRDLIALEYHVDYWDDLVYGLAGRWKDVHSDPAYTQRQRTYAKRLPGGVYTPQLVVDGRTQAVGSRSSEVNAAIAAARSGPRLRLDVSPTDAGDLKIRIDGASAEASAAGGAAQVWLVRFKKQETTKVRAGENRGKTLVNHHVVTGMSPLADWSGGAAELTGRASALAAGEGCAVIVQGADQGPILGAAYCPKTL